LWARRFAQTNDAIHRLFADDDDQLVEDAVEHAGLAVEAVKAPSHRRVSRREREKLHFALAVHNNSDRTAAGQRANSIAAFYDVATSLR